MNNLWTLNFKVIVQAKCIPDGIRPLKITVVVIGARISNMCQKIVIAMY